MELLRTFILVFVLVISFLLSGRPQDASAQGILRCTAFSPYVRGFDPNTGPHPTPELIDRLLDKLVQQTDYRCIQVYGVLHGLDYIATAAERRGLTLFQILWLDTNQADNTSSIDLGIQVALSHPATVLRLSCGSEVRTRHGRNLDPEIRNCITRLRTAGVAQPITSIDTWWQWCNQAWPCQPTDLAAEVDWIGINIFPWWENKFSGIYPCTPVADAPRFHIDRFANVKEVYPDKEIILTEFGWPAGPRRYSEVNQFTGQACGVAAKSNQDFVIKETLRALDARGWQGVIFEAFQQPWKKEGDSPVGDQWGRCRASRPFTCRATVRFLY